MESLWIPDSYWFSGTRSEWSPSILMVFGNAEVLDHPYLHVLDHPTPVLRQTLVLETGGKTTPQPHFVNRVAQIIPPQKLFPPTRWDHFNYTWRGLHCSWMGRVWIHGLRKRAGAKLFLHGASWMVIFEGMSVWGCQAPLENTYM